MTDPKPGVEARLHLVRANRSAIFLMLCRSASTGRPIADAVVVVADTSDPMGFDLAEAASERSDLSVREEATQVQDRGEIPTALIALTLDDAKTLFSIRHPSVAAGLDRQPLPGCIRVVSIAAGAATLIHSDIRPTTNIAKG